VHLNDALGYSESQPGAALLLGDGIVGLLKLLKLLGLISSGGAKLQQVHTEAEVKLTDSIKPRTDLQAAGVFVLSGNGANHSCFRG
jgi:hypothetical protein